MSDPPHTPRAVPHRRLSRALGLGGLAGGMAGHALAEGARRMARGERPRLGDLVLSPGNARRVASELSRMRGAAMKVGQLLSMDAGEVLPPEIAQVLERLREQADPMPPRQLDTVLAGEWGPDWRRRFVRFETRAIAAASIGQVHRAETRDGRRLAVKVQYPGIRAAIDSDVDNMAALLRYSGVVPRRLDLGPLMEDAKRQLHEEADYEREGDALDRFAARLAGDADFVVPRRHGDLSTANVLAMDFVESRPLTALETAPQAERDRVAGLLIDLVLRELFDWGEMQTDPNFANYRVEPATGRVVLLDFGAARRFPDGVPAAFHRLMIAALDRDREAARAAALALRLFGDEMPGPQQEIVLDMIDLGTAPLRDDAPFDFAASPLVGQLREMGLAIGTERDFWHVPATDTLLVQRKVAGTYLMAARLGARVALAPLVARWRDRPPGMASGAGR